MIMIMHITNLENISEYLKENDVYLTGFLKSQPMGMYSINQYTVYHKLKLVPVVNHY